MLKRKQKITTYPINMLMNGTFLIVLLVLLFGCELSRADVHIIYDATASPPSPGGHVMGALYNTSFAVIDSYDSFDQYMGESSVSGSLTYGSLTVSSEVDLWSGTASAESDSDTQSIAMGSGFVDFWVDYADPASLHWLWAGYENYSDSGWSIYLDQITPEFASLGYWNFASEAAEDTVDITALLSSGPTNTYRLSWLFSVASVQKPGNLGVASFNAEIIDGGSPPSYPDIEVSPLMYNYGDVTLGSSKTTMVNISNTDDTADLEVAGLEFTFESSPAFSVTSAPSLPFIIGPGVNVDIEVTFEPFDGDPVESAHLRILSNDPDESLVQVFLYGCGVPVVSVPDIVVTPFYFDFGDVETGSSQATNINISNTGDADLNIDSIVFSSASSGDFSITAPATLPEIIAPGANVNIEITFAPSSPGSSLAVLEINSDDPDSPLIQVDLNGNGIAGVPNIMLSPSSFYDFGSVEVGAESKTVARINNTGSADLIVSSIGFSVESSSSFSITSSHSFPLIVKPGEYEGVEITFSPQSIGYFVAYWQVGSNDPDESLAQAVFDGEGVSVLDVITDPITSKTRWITCHIHPPDGVDVAEINPDTIRLQGASPLRIAVRSSRQIIVARFSAVELALTPSEELVLLTVTGELMDGAPFEGSDYVKIVDRKK